MPCSSPLSHEQCFVCNMAFRALLEHHMSWPRPGAEADGTNANYAHLKHLGEDVRKRCKYEYVFHVGPETVILQKVSQDGRDVRNSALSCVEMVSALEEGSLLP